MEHELVGYILLAVFLLFVGLVLTHHILDKRDRDNARRQRQEKMIEKQQMAAQRWRERMEALPAQSAAPAITSAVAVRSPTATDTTSYVSDRRPGERANSGGAE